MALTFPAFSMLPLAYLAASNMLLPTLAAFTLPGMVLEESPPYLAALDKLPPSLAAFVTRARGGEHGGSCTRARGGEHRGFRTPGIGGRRPWP